MTIEFDEWIEQNPQGSCYLCCEKAFEAGRESVIANRETFQKVKAEGVREGMERSIEIADNKDPEDCEQTILKIVEGIRSEIEQ